MLRHNPNMHKSMPNNTKRANMFHKTIFRSQHEETRKMKRKVNRNYVARLCNMLEQMLKVMNCITFIY